MTVRQNNLLQKAIDNVPCSFSRFQYFDEGRDPCVIGYLSTIAPASGSSRKILGSDRFRGERITFAAPDMEKVSLRLKRAFGLSITQLACLQQSNDNSLNTSNHDRCIRSTKELKSILNERKGE